MGKNIGLSPYEYLSFTALFIEDTVLFQYLFLAPLQNISWSCMTEFTSKISILFHGLHICFYASSLRF